MMISTKEPNVDTNFQPSLWSNTESIVTQNTAEDMIRNIFDIPSQFSLKTLKNIYLKLDLPDWYIFLCTFAENLPEISSTCTSRRFNVSVKSLIGLLLSHSANKIQ